MLLVNYENDSSTNISKYYMLAIYLANTSHLYRNSIFLFFKAAKLCDELYIIFPTHLMSICEKKSSAEFGCLFIQKKWLYRISSFYEKKTEE